MQLPRTRNLGVRVEWRDTSPSTNLTLKALADEDPTLPHGTVLITDTQTAGRGRQGRGWTTPPRTALAISVLVRGFLDTGMQPGWLPLLAGSAVAEALRPHLPDDARIGVKWPNDVHVLGADGKLGPKLCGVLCEMLADGSVVVGCGINVLVPAGELPTPRAGSLLSIGANVRGARTFADASGADLADGIVAGVVGELLRLVRAAGEDPHQVRARIETDSATLGTDVRAHLPGGGIVDGRATRLADDGSLVIARENADPYLASAADIEHLRERAQ